MVGKLINSPNWSETAAQTCAEHSEATCLVVVVLERGLQSDVSVQLVAVCQFNGALCALLESGALNGCAAQVEAATTHSIRRRISMRDTHIISGSDIIITTHAYTEMSIPVSAADI